MHNVLNIMNTATSEKEHRCSCGKLLCKGFVRDGEIHIKCKRCGSISKLKD